MSAVAPTLEAPDRTWRVMIVEDNHAVVALHRRIVDAVPHLKTAHIAWNGEQAYRALEAVKPDLVILDLTMPGGDGMAFLRRIRSENAPIEVIVVTASREGRVVGDAMHLGVVDYLVKPFRPQRLRRALAAFAVRRHTLSRRAELRQADVDAVQGTAVFGERRRLPKGLKETTLRSVVDALEASSEPVVAEEVARRVGIARVTARRYLEYLVLRGAAQVTRETSGPGRPRHLYRLVARGSG